MTSILTSIGISIVEIHFHQLQAKKQKQTSSELMLTHIIICYWISRLHTIDLLHKSHNAPVPYPTMRITLYLSNALWHSCDGSIGSKSIFIPNSPLKAHQDQWPYAIPRHYMVYGEGVHEKYKQYLWILDRPMQSSLLRILTHCAPLMTNDNTEHESTLVQLMACCLTAPSSY